VQWATGNIGSRSLRHIIQHPGLTLAGVYVTSTAKVGRDAGELCGLPPTGVTATGDIGEILALGADCVLYMPADCDLDQVCAILAAGTNIVTTRGEFLHPGSMSPADRERVEQACAEGGTSIHGTGSSPGFISEALPLVLTSIQRRLDALAINEYADVSSRDSPEMLFDLMGFGHPANEFPPERFAYGAYSFGPSMRLVAEAVGLPLDSVTSTGEVAVTPEKLTIAAGTLDAGTVAGLRMVVTGTRAGRALMTFTATWYCSANLEPASRPSEVAASRRRVSRSAGWQCRRTSTALWRMSRPHWLCRRIWRGSRPALDPSRRYSPGRTAGRPCVHPRVAARLARRSPSSSASGRRYSS
jgi:4-hydroxy-tetrahydrodipicolinate reductase